MPFDSPDLSLDGVLKDIDQGKLQLPDFQRAWKWEDDRIRELLVSIGRGHPVGVLMMLQAGGDGAGFAPTPISGAPPAQAPPEVLLLDGQQRLTSLYQSLFSGKPVETTDSRGQKLRRWYYIDINAALVPDSDLDEAILSVPEDKVVREDFGRTVVADYSDIKKECLHEVFPLSRVFNIASVFEWGSQYTVQDPEKGADRTKKWHEFLKRVLHNFIHYTIPAIVLKKDTTKEAVCTVFEKVNTGGVPLNVFELLTATFAIHDFRLKDDWQARRERLSNRPVLRAVRDTDFLQAAALLATRERRLKYQPGAAEADKAPGIGCKRKDMLKLSLDEYLHWADPVTAALEWSAEFLAEEFIFRSADVPYQTQLVPLATIRVILGKDAETIGASRRLRQWYWCGVLGELYGGTTETRFARDVEQVPAWIAADGAVPSTIGDAVFREQRLLTLRTRNSAAYKGIYALLMRAGCRDWLKGVPLTMATFFDWQVDIHHVFPHAWCLRNGIDPAQRESIVNKTPLSRSTNIALGGRAPSEYIGTLEDRAELGPAEMDAVLATHAIEPGHMRSDGFDAFFRARSEALLCLISKAMGKEALREAIEVAAAAEFEPEREDETDGP